jgi:hypothetical protein
MVHLRLLLANVLMVAAHFTPIDRRRVAMLADGRGGREARHPYNGLKVNDMLRYIREDASRNTIRIRKSWATA